MTTRRYSCVWCSTPFTFTPDVVQWCAKCAHQPDVPPHKCACLMCERPSAELPEIPTLPELAAAELPEIPEHVSLDAPGECVEVNLVTSTSGLEVIVHFREMPTVKYRVSVSRFVLDALNAVPDGKQLPMLSLTYRAESTERGG